MQINKKVAEKEGEKERKKPFNAIFFFFWQKTKRENQKKNGERFLLFSSFLFILYVLIFL